jgi:hypothetical protein
MCPPTQNSMRSLSSLPQSGIISFIIKIGGKGWVSSFRGQCLALYLARPRLAIDSRRPSYCQANTTVGSEHGVRCTRICAQVEVDLGVPRVEVGKARLAANTASSCWAEVVDNNGDVVFQFVTRSISECLEKPAGAACRALALAGASAVQILRYAGSITRLIENGLLVHSGYPSTSH